MQWLQIFGLVAMLGGAAILAQALMLQRDSRLALRQHVNLVAGAAPAHEAGLRNHPRAAGLRTRLETMINAPLRRLFSIGKRYRWGMHASAPLLLAIAAVAAAAAWLMAYRIAGGVAWLPPLFALVAFFLVPRFVLVHQQKASEKQFMEHFPNSIDAIVRMLRAGLPVSAAVQTLQTEAPAPLNLVFGSIADQVALGVPFEEALDVVSAENGVQDFRFFAVALKLQQATGGNLAVTLENLSDLIRSRRAMRLKAAAATAEVRISAYVLGALPILTIGALLFLRPGYVAPLFYDARGKYILAAAGGLLLLSFLTMRQMMRRVTAA